MGATGAKLAETMAGSASQSGAAVYSCGDLETALKLARQNATPGDVVLLSPGFASYDQFVNFEQRGEMFAKLAQAHT